jgi:hypothetical protein
LCDGGQRIESKKTGKAVGYNRALTSPLESVTRYAAIADVGHMVADARNKLHTCYKSTLAFLLKLAVDKRRLLLANSDRAEKIKQLDDFDKLYKKNNVRFFIIYIYLFM